MSPVSPNLYSPISLSPQTQVQVGSANSSAQIVQEELSKIKNRNQALLALAKAIVYFECGENALANACIAQGLSTPFLDEVDKQRLNCYKMEQFREPPSEIATSLPLQLPCGNSAEEIALFSLHNSVYYYENKRFEEGFKASQNGLNCQVTSLEVNRLLRFFSFLHCVKSRMYKQADVYLHDLFGYCQQYPHKNILEALKRMLSSFRKPIEDISEASSVFLKQIPSANLDNYTVVRSLTKKENRNKALLALAKTIVFFECGLETLAITARHQGLGFKELETTDSERLNRYKNPKSIGTPQTLISLSLLPEPSPTSKEEKALFFLNAAVNYYEAQQFKEGLKACQIGIEWKSNNNEVKQLLYIFAILNCMKDGQLEFAFSYFHYLTAISENYPYSVVLCKLNERISVLRKPLESILSANSIFMKNPTWGIQEYYRLFVGTTNLHLKELALNNYLYSQKISLESVVGCMRCQFDSKSIAYLVYELNRETLIEIQYRLIALQRLEPAMLNKAPSFFVALFYNLKGATEVESSQFEAATCSFNIALDHLKKGAKYLLDEQLKEIIENNLGTLAAYINKKNGEEEPETIVYLENIFTIFFVEGYLLRVPRLYLIEI